MNEQTNVAHPYSGILFSLGKAGKSDICYNRDELEDVFTVRETRHRRTDTVQFHLLEGLKQVNSMETESRRVAARGWGRGVMGIMLNGDGVSIWEDEVSCMDGGRLHKYECAFNAYCMYT